MNKSFPGLLEYYVVTYARDEAGMSGETLRSYYTSLDQYVLWVKEKSHVEVPAIGPAHFSKDKIREFLIHLEKELGVSIPTRNLRRAGIVSFLEFAAGVCPLYSQAYEDAKSIKVKKAPKPEKTFLTIDEYKGMLEAVDLSRRNGYLHYILISVMYDTAARVDEAVRMNLQDFSFGKEDSVVIYGKGSKYRRIYLTSHSVKLVRDCMERSGRAEGPLFLNRSGSRISDSGIDYVLKKYAKEASATIPSLSGKTISPHVLRRSKATHMLLNGASLPVIQRFLGHESIKTTEAYLEIGSEAMIKAVQKAEEKLAAKGVTMPEISDWKDPDILKRLKKLAR